MEVLAILISAGGAAMILALVKAWRDIKSGAAADERDRIEEAEDRRKSAEVDRDAAITVANYWRTRSGILEYFLLREGGALPEFPEEPKLTFTLPSFDTPQRVSTITEADITT